MDILGLRRRGRGYWLCRVWLLAMLMLCLPKGSWADDGVFYRSHQYFLAFDDEYDSYDAATKTYVYTKLRYENHGYMDVAWVGSTNTPKVYEGYKVTLVGAKISLGSFLGARFKWGDNVSFPNGGKIIIEFPKQETPDYTKPCFSYFACYVTGGGKAMTEANAGGLWQLESNENTNSGYWASFSLHKDAKGNMIDQTGRFEVVIPAGSSVGSGLALYGINFFMGDPAKILVNNTSAYWWIAGGAGEPQGRDIEYSGSEQSLLTPHHAVATSISLVQPSIFKGGAKFHYRWRKTDHDGSSPTAWSAWSTQQPAATEVGRYEMQYWATSSMQGMYGDPGSAAEAEEKGNVIVSRILRTLTDINDPKPMTLMYNFKAQNLLTAGTSSQGTYMYRLGKQGAWSETIPTATDVGTYKLYWYIKGDPTRFYKDVGFQQDPKDSVEVTIVPLDLATTAMTVTDNSHSYDGKPHKALVKVMCGTTEINTSWYDVFYGPSKSDVDETNFGDYDVTIKAVDGYPNVTGQQTKGLLSIGRFNLSQSLGNLGPRLYTAQKIEPTMGDLPKLYMTDNETEITQDNFTITAYGENINAGTGSVTITANDGTNYTGSRTLTFDITKRDAVVTALPQTIVYNTEGQFQSSGAANASLTLATTYADGYTLDGAGHALKTILLTSEDTQRNVGTYTGSIIPANAKIQDAAGNDVTANYNVTYAAADLTITQKPFSSGDLTVGGLQQEYVYTGSALTPAPIVRDKGKALSSADYDVAYSDNTAVGDAATVSVSFKGNYSGSTSATFVIYRQVDATRERTNGDANYYRTYYNNSESLEIRDASKYAAYTATISSDKTKAVLTSAGTVIPSGTPVMLVATETPVKLYKASSESTTDFSGNVLQGTDTHSGSLTGDEHYYIFNGDVFIWATEGTMDASKAFIDGTGLSAARLAIVFADGETTGLNEELRMKNEELTDTWYDLQGRKIVKLSNRPIRPGLYIHNGRKEVIR